MYCSRYFGCIIHKEDTGSNLADILMKCLSADKTKYLIERTMTDCKVKSHSTKEISFEGELENPMVKGLIMDDTCRHQNTKLQIF